jgi:flavodoxin
MNTLVVYFSRTGNTKFVAEEIATALNAASECITEVRSRLGLFGYCWSLVEAVSGRSPPIQTPAHDPRNYDLVVIGTPIWGWHLSAPVRSYARMYEGSIGRTAFFCTMGGSGAEKAFAELELILRRQPVATLAVSGSDLADQSSLDQRLKEFVKRLRAQQAQPAQRATTVGREFGPPLTP